MKATCLYCGEPATRFDSACNAYCEKHWHEGAENARTTIRAQITDTVRKMLAHSIPDNGGYGVGPYWIERLKDQLAELDGVEA